jgi:hypothetical protein
MVRQMPPDVTRRCEFLLQALHSEEELGHKVDRLFQLHTAVPAAGSVRLPRMTRVAQLGVDGLAILESYGGIALRDAHVCIARRGGNSRFSALYVQWRSRVRPRPMLERTFLDLTHNPAPAHSMQRLPSADRDVVRILATAAYGE